VALAELADVVRAAPYVYVRTVIAFYVAAALGPDAAVATGVAAAGVCDEIPHGRDKSFYQLATRTDLPD